MKKVSFAWLAGPFVFLLLITFIILAERTGIRYQQPQMQAVFLPSGFSGGKTAPVEKECLLLYDSQLDGSVQYKENIVFVLESMSVAYDALDLTSVKFPGLSGYETVIVAMQDYDVIGESIFMLSDWVKSGGRVLLAMTPEYGVTFDAIYPKLGIQYFEPAYSAETGLRFETELMPGAKGMEFGAEAIDGAGMVLRLTDACRTHMVSTDEKMIPMLWEHDYGKGRFVVSNSDMMGNKEARGVVAAAYSLLQDAFAYPVINASMFFIDDFPSPLEEGYDETITRDYGRSIMNFYKNIWWPDLLSLSMEYDLRYTGLLVETYNDQVRGPFTRDTDVENFKYFGRLLIKNGGELGFHGYNHMPLCLENFDYKGILEYNKWPDRDQMAAAVSELIRFGTELFPDEKPVTYVPPSNVISEAGLEILKDKFPQIRVISGSYIGGALEHEQEFEKDKDGIIHVPRIAAGCLVTPYMRWTALNEIGFHYVNSHFLHPDDILDVERSAGKGWADLRNALEEYMAWIRDVAPGIRGVTARQGAAAVERYDCLTVEKQFNQEGITLILDGFYDEAWLMVRLNKGAAGQTEGGSIRQVGENLYLVHATAPTVIIYTKEGAA